MSIKIRERIISIFYGQDLIDWWNEQTDEFKQLCEDIGKPYGYSGMNIFYFWCFIYYLVHYGEMELRPFWKKKDTTPLIYYE